MINRQQLLADLKPLLKDVEADLRARCDEVPQIDADLKQEYEQARAAGRSGVTYEEWRADLITQVAVAWVLSCVFVRFLEDNALIAPPRISGPLHGAGTDAGLMRARDERETYFKTHPKQTDRDYLLAVFDDLARLPGTKDVFGPHNVALAYRNWLSGDAGQKLIEFFQKIDKDGTGEIIHDFTDANWDTRFLGDLYQDLSEAARKKYALLQTPVFVEEFILERTLEPAIKEFGLGSPPSTINYQPSTINYFKMIDPACGSGHFLLGSFARILKHWRAKEPGTHSRELVNRALAAVHGVDLNPYAVAIARFRLLIAAMRECHIARLADAPAFAFNLVCGDSLLHGSPGGEQQFLGFHELAHVYQSEDLPELQRILRPGGYHAVVANPPYITVKDKALNQAYRDRYPDVCHMKYSVAVPFLQRLFVLACSGGFTGQITANSFMNNEFGTKLVEKFLPRIDLTHIVDSRFMKIPGHGTPTVILFGRAREPVASTIRTVMGIKGEQATPQDPAQGLVWSAILQQIDHAGSQSAFVSVRDTCRQSFSAHPWSIGGGGAAELKEMLDRVGDKRVGALIDTVGFASFTGNDEVFASDAPSLRRYRVLPEFIRTFIYGEVVRDWSAESDLVALAPYDEDHAPVPPGKSPWGRYVWRCREILRNWNDFGGRRRLGNDEPWWAWYRWIADKYRTQRSIVFAFKATHNHFVLDRGGKVFSRTSPVIKLPANATEDDHLALLGLLNSSTGAFWERQVHRPVTGEGNEQWEVRLERNGTKVEDFPLPSARPVARARALDDLARRYAALLPDAVARVGAAGAAPGGRPDSSAAGAAATVAAPQTIARDSETIVRARETIARDSETIV